MHITVNKRFESNYRLSYSETEICSKISDIRHPIFRAVLQEHGRGLNGVEIISMADIPSGTGLGSSSSFTVGLLHALKSFQGSFQRAEDLATEACRIEIDLLKEPIGKQDQYAAAFGGLRAIRFQPNGEVRSEPIICSPQTYDQLESSVLMFFTGFSRSASQILAKQSQNIASKMPQLRSLKAAAERMKTILESNGQVQEIGGLLHESWMKKKELASGISNPQIDTWYEKAMQAGAWGGKVLGAGGGGFLMFMCPSDKHAAVKAALSDIRFVETKFERLGSRIIFVD